MTGVKSLFSTLEEKDLQILIAMVNDEKYSVSSVGTVIFQREHGAHLTLIDVKYVLGPKRNLVLITMLEDRGYDIVFSKGKVFLRPVNNIQKIISSKAILLSLYFDDVNHGLPRPHYIG